MRDDCRHLFAAHYLVLSACISCVLYPIRVNALSLSWRGYRTQFIMLLEANVTAIGRYSKAVTRPRTELCCQQQSRAVT